MSIVPGKLSAVCAAGILTLAAGFARADQLQMQNGDRYAGKILSVTSNTVVLQSDVLGTVTLPRNQVASLIIGEAAPNITRAIPASSPNTSATNADLSAALRNLGADTNFIQQVRQQVLGGSPEASQKYDEMVGELLGDKLSTGDIRNQAQASIDQINQLKKELGPDAGNSLDSYLAILQSFVNESASDASAPAGPAATNTNSASAPAPMTQFKISSPGP
jgi:hypothetical protein